MKKINENQKVTLTLGQLKRLVAESENEEWCVIRLGKGRSWETISNMYGSESCVITDDSLSKEEARASAKEQAKELPDSLKNMYGWSFKAVPMSAVKKIEKAKGDWCVVSFGGSIGKNHKYHCRYGACSIESDNLTQDDAKEEAKESRKYRTSTDKYYGITYRALPRSDVKDNESIVRESQTMSIKDFAEMEGLDEEELFDAVARNYPECEFDDELSLDQLAWCAQECKKQRPGYLRESDNNGDDPRLPELKKAIRKIIGFFPDNVTMSNNGFTCGTVQFKVDASESIPWRAISVEPITIEGPLGDQMAGYVISRFITSDKSSVQRIVDLFK